jgi:serine/threonine protein kinase
MEKYGGWEVIEPPLGEGGQSKVYLVRTPVRTTERARCLAEIRSSLDGDRRAELATSIFSYAREDYTSELGALKVFKIPPDGKSLTPPPGSDEYEAIERLKNEIGALRRGGQGLPKLLDSNIELRWIVTEYFPERTLEHHPSRYRGNAPLALKAFRSLVQTVALLHKEGYIHRDIKPANVFIRCDDELVLGDFGIVYVPNAPDRITQSGERVGPRDYMPQWANLGVRQEQVEPCSDVYMLGKLLWSMVDGRAVLPREYHSRPEFDLTKTFPNDPHMYLINRILDKCVVEDSDQCLSSAVDLFLMIEEMLTVIERGGQALAAGVPRPCHVCGKGSYRHEQWRTLSPAAQHEVGQIRIWVGSGGADLARLGVKTFICDYCGHVEFFRA